MSSKITDPYELFYDTDGDQLDSGAIYVGVAGLDAKTNQVQAYSDKALTVPVAQPITTINGRPTVSGTPINIYVSANDFSTTVENKNGTVVQTILNRSVSGDFTGSTTVAEIANLLTVDTTLFTTAIVSDPIRGGIFEYDVTQSGTNNGGTIFNGWVRQYSGAVNVKWFGAIGDGVVDDTAAIQAALNTLKSIFVPDGVFLYNSSIFYTADKQSISGNGNLSILKSANGSVYINCDDFDDCSIFNLQIDGSSGTNGGIRLTNGTSKYTIQKVYFFQGGQRVWLFECDNVIVTDCIFENTGYGVLQQFGFASSYVAVTNCIAKNMKLDFVEANCAATAPSKFWSINDNIFEGNENYPTLTGNEFRFVGITSVEGVTINGNMVQKVSGDAAIHLEDSLGDTVISGNVFDNCLGSGGNEGYIYLLNTAENTIISNNVFLRTDGAIADAYALDCGSASYGNSVQFVGNMVLGLAAGGNFNGVNLKFQTGKTVISGNVFDKLNEACSIQNTDNVLYCGNTHRECTEGIFLTRTTDSAGGNDWLVSSNVFESITNRDIFTTQNTNGTSAPNRWSVMGNIFDSEVRIEGLSGGVVGSSSDAQDISLNNNIFKNGAIFNLSGTMSRRTRFGNVFQSLNQTPYIQDLPDYADDAAASAGGIQIGGMYRTGSILKTRVA